MAAEALVKNILYYLSFLWLAVSLALYVAAIGLEGEITDSGAWNHVDAANNLFVYAQLNTLWGEEMKF